MSPASQRGQSKRSAGGATPWARKWVVGVAAAAVVAAGCSSGDATGAVKPPPTTTTTTAPTREQQVLQAYASAVQAITDAEVHGDPNWPALGQTMVEPELSHVRAFITASKNQGYRATGSARVVHSNVSSISDTRADVEACVHDEVISVDATGKPVAGNAGRATFSTEKAVMVATGATTWALQDGTAQQFSTAQEAGPLCTE